MISLEISDEGAMAALGARLAGLARPGDVLALHGGLGAGKTVLARSFVRAFIGQPQEDVPSPTFTLVQTYEGTRGEVWHFDLYRLERPEDALELDIEEAFAQAVCLIEWPERLGGLLPASALRVDIDFGATKETRRVRLTGWADRKDELNG